MHLIRRQLSLVALIIGAGWSLGAGASPPDLGAPEGAERTAHMARPYDSYDLPTMGADSGMLAGQTLTGEVLWQAFRLSDPAASTVGVLSGYRARLSELGFEPVFSCQSQTCGGFDFRFNAAILPAPAMLLDVADFTQFSARRDQPEAYASVLVSRVHGVVYIQTVSIEPGEAPSTVAPAPSIVAETEISRLPGDERALLATLLADGHVPVEGLAFEQGGARLSASSAGSLDMLARLLARDAELSVYIVGHSDNAGTLDVNLQLSQRRAEAVRSALISRGVPEGQVSARGVAFLAPLTSNETPEGRARNRRVELVLR